MRFLRNGVRNASRVFRTMTKCRDRRANRYNADNTRTLPLRALCRALDIISSEGLILFRPRTKITLIRETAGCIFISRVTDIATSIARGGWSADGRVLLLITRESARNILWQFYPATFPCLYRARSRLGFLQRRKYGGAGGGGARGWVIFHRKSTLSLTHVRVLQSIFPAQREAARAHERDNICRIAICLTSHPRGRKKDVGVGEKKKEFIAE